MMLTLDQEAQVRAYFQDTAAFFAHLDTWLSALERGERPTAEQ